VSSNGASRVGGKAPCGLSAVGLLAAALRTGRARSRASGSPRTHGAGVDHANASASRPRNAGSSWDVRRKRAPLGSSVASFHGVEIRPPRKR